MTVSYYDLDREVFLQLQAGVSQLDKWKGPASGIAEYVTSWGVERFWAMSRSLVLKEGQMPDIADMDEFPDEKKRYFSWGVARLVLCNIVGDDLKINSTMTTSDFLEKFRKLDFNQQVLLTDLLIEIADTIQFWTMRLSDVYDINGKNKSELQV